MTTPLAEELAIFDAHRFEWINRGHEGKYAVVIGDQLIGFYAGFERAYFSGAAVTDRRDFLVKKVLEVDPIETVYRMPPPEHLLQVESSAS